MATVENAILIPALELVDVVAAGDSPSTAERDHAFARLNDIIDSLNAEPDLIVKQTVTDVVSAGSSPLTLSTRPLLIMSATAIYASVVSQPVQVCTPSEWAGLAIDKYGQATFPRGVLCDYADPTSLLYVAPKFTGTLQLVQLVKAFTEYSAVGDTVTLSAGYRKFLIHALAAELARIYGHPLMADMIALADKSKAPLTTINSSTRIPAPPPAA